MDSSAPTTHDTAIRGACLRNKHFLRPLVAFAQNERTHAPPERGWPCRSTSLSAGRSRPRSRSSHRQRTRECAARSPLCPSLLRPLFSRLPRSDNVRPTVIVATHHHSTTRAAARGRSRTTTPCAKRSRSSPMTRRASRGHLSRRASTLATTPARAPSDGRSSGRSPPCGPRETDSSSPAVVAATRRRCEHSEVGTTRRSKRETVLLVVVAWMVTGAGRIRTIAVCGRDPVDPPPPSERRRQPRPGRAFARYSRGQLKSRSAAQWCVSGACVYGALARTGDRGSDGPPSSERVKGFRICM